MTLPVLYRHFFQFGYVVRDLDGAMRTLRERMGVTQWEVRHLPPTAPGRALAFAYVDGVMIELVDIRPEEDTIYRAWIPETDDGLRLHHLGYMIEDEGEWDATIAQYEAAGFAPALVGGIPGRMQWYYADTVATLGHYSELVRFTSEAGKAYWAQVPHNKTRGISLQFSSLRGAERRSNPERACMTPWIAAGPSVPRNDEADERMEGTVNFAENEDIAALRDMLQRFVAREATPEMAERWDREDRIEREMLVKLAGLGLCGLTVPEEFGGMGRRVIETVVTIVELAKRSTALAGIYIMNACYGSLNVAMEGTPEQQQRFLPGLLAGEILFAYGLSEPDVGADLASVTTRAERRGDTVVINGQKRWCSGANFADHILMLVRSGEAEARYQNLSLVLVPTQAPGLTLEQGGTMGVRGIPVNDVILDNVEVPFANVLGGEAKWNNGWSLLAGPALEIEKLETPALALGVAEAAVAEAWEYSQQRKQFGAPICTIQSIRHMLSDVQTKLQAARLMLMSAAWKVDQGLPSAVDTSMAKLFVSDTARDVVLTCQQVLGAYGYAHGFAMERYVRDALVMPIWGGSSAIQKNNIANLMRLPRK